MNQPLSPAAQAVLDAVASQLEGGWISPEFMPYEARKIAAALRAAADQSRFQDQLGLTAYGGYSQAQDQILAIVAELDGTNPTNQEDYKG